MDQSENKDCSAGAQVGLLVIMFFKPETINHKPYKMKFNFNEYLSELAVTYEVQTPRDENELMNLVETNNSRQITIATDSQSVIKKCKENKLGAKTILVTKGNTEALECKPTNLIVSCELLPIVLDYTHLEA